MKMLTMVTVKCPYCGHPDRFHTNRKGGWTVRECYHDGDGCDGDFAIFFREGAEPEVRRIEGGTATLKFPAPKSCFECRLAHETEDGVYCSALEGHIEEWNPDNNTDEWENRTGRYESCPLVIT